MESSIKQTSKGFAWGCIGVVVSWVALSVCALFVCIAIVGWAIDAVGKLFSEIDIDREGGDDAPNLSVVWCSGTGSVDIAWIPLHGEIGSDSSDEYNSDYALKAIRRARTQENVKGIILELNTPGGAITPSDIIYHELMRFKESDPERKVLALFSDLVASGGYYVAMASDWIVAHPTTLTGSIGVIMSTYNLHDLAKRLGIQDVSIKSGANKDILNPLRPVAPEQTQMLQQQVDALHRRFKDLIQRARKIDQAELDRIADGRVFLAEEALRLRLLDEIGYREDAISAMGRLLGLDSKDLFLFRYEEPMSYKHFLPPFLRRLMLSEGRAVTLKYAMP